MTKIELIIACDSNGGIGIDNKLPWPHNNEDMKKFKEVTDDSVVVMGSNTWYSLPIKLPNRTNVVLSTNSVTNADYVINSRDTQDIVDRLVDIQYEENRRNVVVIGGKFTYELLLPYVGIINLSLINGEYECDTFIDVELLTENFSMIDCTYLNKNTMFKKFERTNPA